MAKSCKIYFPDSTHEESAYVNRTHEGELYLFPSTTGKMYVTRFDYTYEMEGFSNVIEIGCSDITMFNKAYGAGGSFGFAVGISDVEADTKHSLGTYDDGIAVGLTVSEDATKYIVATNKVGIGASADIVMTWETDSTDVSIIEVGTEASIVLGYYRLLNEMDEDTLATYDNETVKDVDYIISG